MGRRPTHTLAAILISTAMHQFAQPLAAQTAGGFEINTQYITGLSSPTAMAYAPDGRLFIAQQGGVVRVVSSTGQLLATPFIALSGVRSDEERGLLGIAFDPQFTSNGYVYLFYTPGNYSRLSRVTANGNVAVTGSELTLFQYDNISANHRGGDIHFGPDGKLYLALGEAGEPPNSQSVTSYNGKILRFNRDGTVPADNPSSFVSTSGATLTPSGPFRAIWAIGLRNPYRFSFGSTGEMRINDVGAGLREEVNVGQAGANYGWPTCEGTCSNAYARNPIYTYERGVEGCAITGGAFQRGGNFPATYAGNYFIIDYCRTWLRFLRPDNSWGTHPLAIPNSSVDLEFGPDGSLFILGHGTGVLSRMTYTAAGGNRNPIVQASAKPTSGAPPLAVALTAAGSSDPDGDPLTYAWTFGDGMAGTGVSVSHTYANAGSYTARVTASDGRGGSGVAQVVIAVGTAPVPSIVQPVQGATYAAGNTINFSGMATDANDGTLGASAFSWTVLFHHDTHTHPVIGPLNGVTSGSFTIPTMGHTEDTVFYRIYLTVTDSTGLQTQITRDVNPRKARITLNTNASGGQVLLDGQPVGTPYSFTGVVGVQRTLDVPSPQTIGATTYAFSSWSDGGAKSHVISSPVADTTYTATLTPQSTQPAPAPFVRWPLDNNLVEVVRATSTGGRGTIAYSTDRAPVSGNVASLTLDGSDGTYAQVAGDNILDAWSAATVSAWLKVSNATATSWASNSYHSLLFKYGVLQTRILKDASGQLRLVATHGDGGGLGTPIVSTAAIRTDAWVHVASVHQGTTVTLYVDGQMVGTGNTGRSFGAASNDTLDLVGFGGHYAGLIDDLQIFNSNLSSSQINALRSVGSSPPLAPTSLRIIQ